MWLLVRNRNSLQEPHHGHVRAPITQGFTGQGARLFHLSSLSHKWLDQMVFSYSFQSGLFYDSVKAAKLEKWSIFTNVMDFPRNLTTEAWNFIVKFHCTEETYDALLHSCHTLNWEFPLFNIQWWPVWISPAKTPLIPLLQLHGLPTELCRISKYFSYC